MIRHLPLLAVLLAISGCGGDREPPFAQTRLIIRLEGATPAGVVDRFADEYLAPLFPVGVTRLEARQQWRNGDGTLTSAPCVVFEMIHLANADNAKRVDGAILLAKRQFGAKSVVMIQGRPDVRY